MIRKPSILASNAVTPESFVAPGSGSGSGSELRLDSPVGFEGPVPAAPSNDHIHSTTALRSNLEPKNHYFSASTTAAAAAAGTTSAPGVAGGSDGERKIVVETTSTTDQKHRSYSDQTTTATNTTNTTSLYSRSSSLLELARYSFRETSRNKCGYLVGCSSVYLVVFTVAVLMSILNISPLINLTIAEQGTGEIDMLVTPIDVSNALINYTFMNQQLQSADDSSLPRGSPRITKLAVNIFRASDCLVASKGGSDGGYIDLLPQQPIDWNTFTFIGKGANISTTAQWNCVIYPAYCIYNVCPNATTVNLWAIENSREKSLNMGRSWILPPLSNNSVYISNHLASHFNLGVGSTLIISLNLSAQFPHSFYSTFNNTNASYDLQEYISSNYTTVPTGIANAPFVVSSVFSADYSSKFPYGDMAANMIIAEYSQILASFAPYLHPAYPQLFRDTLVNQSATLSHEESPSVAFSCGSPRYLCYLETSVANIADKILSWSSNVLFHAGFTELSGSANLLEQVNQIAIFGQFVVLMGSIVVILMCALSVFLIYNLMMGNVETKTFELGVLRMVGLTRWGIIQYLLIQSMTYALPAWMIGLGGAQGLFVLVKKIVYTASKINVSVLLSPASIAVSTVLGIAVPVLAAILPIRKALGNNLRDSLDKRANKTKAILITIQRNEPGSIRGMEPLIASGTVLIVAGFAIYYLLPMSLLNGDITLLFNIFFAIILGMLFGLVMLSINLQPLVERLIIWIMFDFMFTSWMFHERGGVLFFEGRAIKKLLGKNLLAHKLRNRKTSTAFSFALGFIVFLASNLNVQFFSLQYASIQGTACDFQVYTDIGSSYTIINMDLLDNYLSTNHPYIQQYSWISQPLLSILSNYENDIQLETMARISKDPVNVRAVSPNFIENFYIINPYIVEINQMSPNLLEAIREGLVMGITEGLYADVGDESALMSSYLLSDLGLGQDISNISSSPFSSSSLSSNTSNQYYDPVILRKIHYTYPYTSFQDNVIRPMGFMDHVGFVYMTDQPTNSRSDLLVSFPTLVDLTGGVLSSVEDVNIQAVLIYLDTNLVNNTMRNKLWIELQSIMTANHVVRLQDQLDSTSSSLNLMNLIFTIATGLIMLITLFSLNICMMTNIWEQKGEIGVLRALGVKKWAIFRLYVYEAFIIVSSSGFLGLMIGTCVGWTMSLQQSVQSGQPIFFPFPVNLAVLVLAGSVVSALISTFAPIYALLGGRRKKIVGLLKG